MTIKELISEFIKQNGSVLGFLENTGRDYENADLIVKDFAAFIEKSNYNPALGLDFASVLWQLNDRSIFEQFELADISKLLESLLSLQEYNIDTYVELAHFEWAIMDNSGKTKDIIQSGIEKANQKIAELERLKISIEKE